MNAQKIVARPVRVSDLPWLVDVIPDIIIAKRDGHWCIVLGGHYVPTKFLDYKDPASVAKFIKSRTAGPINVIVDFGQ